MRKLPEDIGALADSDYTLLKDNPRHPPLRLTTAQFAECAGFQRLALRPRTNHGQKPKSVPLLSLVSIRKAGMKTFLADKPRRQPLPFDRSEKSDWKEGALGDKEPSRPAYGSEPSSQSAKRDGDAARRQVGWKAGNSPPLHVRCKPLKRRES